MFSSEWFFEAGDVHTSKGIVRVLGQHAQFLERDSGRVGLGLLFVVAGDGGLVVNTIDRTLK